MKSSRLKIAIQKKGRLYDDSMELLKNCGAKLKPSKSDLYCHAENMPIDVLFVRDDDIPTLVKDNICDIGIVGENVLFECDYDGDHTESSFDIIKKLKFSKCRLSLAVQKETVFKGVQSLNGSTVATSYPNIVKKYLDENNVEARVLTISGSVEIAPALNMAPVICDLVSTGKTLEENGLKEVLKILDSQAVLIKSKDPVSPYKQDIFDLILSRIQGVIKANGSKYVMFHAPKSALDKLKTLLPGSESQTVIPLNNGSDKVVVHVVTTEGVFWQTLEKLKEEGASSILVLPIEKMLS
jgi:ATP phosphoribosyltransferase